MHHGLHEATSIRIIELYDSFNYLFFVLGCSSFSDQTVTWSSPTHENLKWYLCEAYMPCTVKGNPLEKVCLDLTFRDICRGHWGHNVPTYFFWRLHLSKTLIKSSLGHYMAQRQPYHHFRFSCVQLRLRHGPDYPPLREGLWNKARGLGQGWTRPAGFIP